MRILLKGFTTLVMVMAIIGNSSTSFFFIYNLKTRPKLVVHQMEEI